MNKVTKIIVKTWIGIFLKTTLGLFMLVAFGDIVNNILRNKYTFLKITQNFLLNSSFMIENILPISSIIATLFTFNKLKNHSELIAIIATGYSKRSIAKLILLLALIPAFIQLINKDFLSIYLSKKQSELSKEVNALNRSVSTFGFENLWFKGKDYFGSFLFFSPQNSTLNKPVIYLLDKHKVTKIIKAKTAKSIGNGAWLFSEVKVLSKLSSEKDFPEENLFTQYQVNLNKKVEDFQQFQSGIKTLNFFRLYKFINQLKSSGFNITEYSITLYEKISLPLICIIFALFPIFSLTNINRRSSSTGKSVVFALLFSIAFWILNSGFKSLAMGGNLAPIIGTFCLPILIAIFIAYSYFFLEKLR